MSIRPRLFIALAIGILAGVSVWIAYRVPPDAGTAWASDWDMSYLGAQALWRGENPYHAFSPQMSPWPLVYPLPAVLLALPFAWLPLPLARAIWFAIGAGCLAFVWSDKPYRLTGLLSGGFIWAAAGAQWTPLLVASVGLPWLGIAYVGKPTIATALFARQPTWPPIIGAIVLGAASFALYPGWLWDWRESLQHMYGLQLHHLPLVARPFGWLLLGAALRWRNPGARLLLACALFPQSGLPYDLIVLLLLAETKWQWYFLVAMSQVVMVVGITLAGTLHLRDLVAALWPATLVLCYLPALAMVLRQPLRYGAPSPAPASSSPAST
jgi:hypothetical protein